MKNNKFKNKSHKMIEEINKNDYKIVNDGRRVNPLKKNYDYRYLQVVVSIESCDFVDRVIFYEIKIH